MYREHCCVPRKGGWTGGEHGLQQGLEEGWKPGLSGSPHITSQWSLCPAQLADLGRQLSDRADAAGICLFPGQTLPAPAPRCWRRGSGLLPGAHETAPEYLCPQQAPRVCAWHVLAVPYLSLYFSSVSHLRASAFSVWTLLPWSLYTFLPWRRRPRLPHLSITPMTEGGKYSQALSGSLGSPTLLSPDTQQG